MTMLPHPSRQNFGVDGPHYELNVFCPVPGCPKEAHERHHIWRRSFTGGDHWWVKIVESGEVVGNCMNICSSHHRELTDNASQIVYEDGRFYWNTLLSARQELRWQPPFQGKDFATAAEGQPAEQEHMHTEREKCPTCMRPMPKPKIETPREEKKIRKVWGMGVPVDQREDGAQTMDDLVEAGRHAIMEFSDLSYDESTPKFNIVTTLMSLAVLHAPQLFSNG